MTIESRTFRLLMAFLAIVAAGAVPASAHDTWLLPEAARVAPGEVVALDLTSGMAFPALDHAIEADRVDRARMRLGGVVSEIGAGTKGAKSLRFSAPLEGPGVATIWIDLGPRPIELKPAEAEEYLKEIGAPESVWKAWGGAAGGRPWREIYTKHAKTFVRAGASGTDRGWAESVGTLLELVPETDPTALRAGGELAVRVLSKGVPLPGFSVGLVHQGTAAGSLLTSDDQGKVRIRLDRSGWWLLRGTLLRASSKAGADWESEFATLTIQAGVE